MTSRERVNKGMEFLRAGLAPFVERESQTAVKAGTVRMEPHPLKARRDVPPLRQPVANDSHTLTVLIPLAVKSRGGRKAIITPGVLSVESRHDITLIKAVARAFRWLRMLEAGKFATITELAAAEKINASYVSRILRLTLLAPDVVEAILDGRQPEGMTLPGLMEGIEAGWGLNRFAPIPSHLVVGAQAKHQ